MPFEKTVEDLRTPAQKCEIIQDREGSNPLGVNDDNIIALP